ncbi:MAG: glutaredoxin family protein [Pyrinomonadaceae bacterium]|nr:glutaredoxin family protein [Pyrinomonadaceae bacterium]
MTAKPAIPEKVQVTLYTRPGCHLCDEAKEAMLAARCAEEYTLDEVNIESDPRLLHSYRQDIPVVLIDGLEAFRHRVATDEFRRRVAMAARSGNDTPQR